MGGRGGFWTDAPLLRKGAAVVAIPLVVMLVAAAAGISLLRMHATARKAVVHTLDVRREASLAAQDAAQAWAERSTWLLSGEKRDLDRMKAAFAKVEERIGHMADLVSDNPSQAERVGRAREVLTVWHGDLGESPEKIARTVRLAEGDALEVRTLLEEVFAEEQRLLLERLDREERTGRSAIVLLSAAVLTGIAGALAALVVFSRAIVRRIEELGAYADRRARGEGNGDRGEFGKDEIGGLAVRFAQAADAIQRREADLARSRARLQAIVDNMTSGLFIKNREGVYLFANATFTKQLGREDVVGKTVRDLLPEDAASKVEAADAEVFEKGVPTIAEHRFLLPGGVQDSMAARFLLPGDDGEPTLCTMTTDITERVRAEEELARSRARLQAIIDNMATGLFIKNRGGIYEFANATFARQMGRGDLVGKSVRDLVSGEAAHAVEDADRAIFETGLPSVVEHRMPLPSGERCFMAVRFLLPGEGGESSLCIMTTDVTERVLAMEELRRTRDELEIRVAERTKDLAAEVEERNAANTRLHYQLARMKMLNQLARMKMLNQIAKAIAGRHDLASLFQTVLNHLRDHLGIELGIMMYFEEKSDLLVVGARVADDKHADVLPDLKPGSVSMLGSNGLRSCVSGKTIHMPDVSYSTEGVIGDLAKAGLGAAVAAPLRVGEETLGVLLAVRERKDSFNSGETEYLTHLGEHVAIAIAQLKLMDELHRAYTDLRETQETMAQQERLRAMGQMASGIAHDINNALGPISIYCEMMAEDMGLPAETRRQVKTILKASEGIARTVENLRHFYRPADGSAKPSNVRVNELVRSIVDLTRPRWKDIPQQSGITISLILALSEVEPEFQGFEGEIRNALTNLIFNSVDAMPDGGTIAVRTATDDERVTLEVSDSGVGMDQRTKARCFEPFFTTKGESGTGLGLPMVFGIVKRHDGTIDIESVSGSGTTFRLVFPKRASLALPESSNIETPIQTRHLRVLSVDDDPMLRESMMALLSAEGHAVQVVENGKSAIAACENAEARGHLYDVVITDLGMPGMDGRELAMKLKSRWPDLPIILLTGWGSHLMEQAERMGEFVSVLAKPPRTNEVRAALRRACP